MKLLVLDKNPDNSLTVLNSQPTSLTDNAQLPLISVGDKVTLLVADDDAHQVGDTYKAP